MPRDYLKTIEHAAFPLRVEDSYAIGCIHVLRAAALLEAGVTPGRDMQGLRDGDRAPHHSEGPGAMSEYFTSN